MAEDTQVPKRSRTSGGSPREDKHAFTAGISITSLENPFSAGDDYQTMAQGDSESSRKKQEEREASFRQYIMAILVNLTGINSGFMFGFSAISLPQMGHLTATAAGSLTTPLGCVLSGVLADAVGRKPTLLLTQAPSLVGWLVLAATDDFASVCAARALTGLGAGMASSPARIYVAEATQTHLRGTLSALGSVTLSLGVCLVYLLGSLVQWQAVAAVSAAVPAVCLVGLLFVPESPAYLAGRRDLAAARRALRKLRGNGFDIENEIKELSLGVKEVVEGESRLLTKLKTFRRPALYKPLGLLIMYFVIYQCSGVNAVTFYAVNILIEATPEYGDGSYYVAVSIGVIRLLFTIWTCYLLKIMGRKTLTLISAVGCGISMILLGVYIHFTAGCTPASCFFLKIVQWVPAMLLNVFTAVSTVGYLTVPWVMVGEVYPPEVRGFAAGLSSCICYLFIFAVVKTFKPLEELVQMKTVFWGYGTISLFGSVLFWFFLPETKGKSLKEIEAIFTGEQTE
ncbi:facilitated trehalose transporter Tret1-2 homolog isoform X2 [Bacillus rossius redtenbacheri]|uniref:facilitated trehalose transporter Tret1-2 homolog isoform X2 n=1 Tax=Bacillus rossius redtenbacheri TaxID=93214 RepID=UPI002FDC9F76